MDNDFLSISEAASFLKVHPETLRRWDRDGTLSAVRVNARGDRRWRRIDVLTFLQNQSRSLGGLVPFSQGNYEIIQISKGFEMFPDRFGLIAKFIARNERKHVGFVFAAAGMDVIANASNNKDLTTAAIEVIKDKLTKDSVFDDEIYTFEYRNIRFGQVEFPDWFNAPLRIVLIEGLRIDVERVHPIKQGVETWRVIVAFKVNQGGKWLKTGFGPKLNQYEYFVELSAEYLEDFTKFPPSDKGASIFALRYVQNRFEETKNENGDRSIERIGEIKVACWDGKCRRGEHIPLEI